MSSDSYMDAANSPRRSPNRVEVLPKAWEKFRRVFGEMATELSGGHSKSRQQRERILKKIEALKEHLEEEIQWGAAAEHLPESIKAASREVIGTLRRQHRNLLGALEVTLEAFITAQENEDRFVVLVFGEVNAGKSALANHLAGMDFGDSVPPPRSECFMADQNVPRLEELPIECTNQYQGFRRPGLLWIDCPGILSGTFANASLARRLVSRADFLIFVSSSDAPFKASEMVELGHIISGSGQKKVDACLVVTKADSFDIDEDPETGREFRKVVAKKHRDWVAQGEWCREQFLQSGLGAKLRIRDPLAVSVYLARSALGRRWEDGRYVRNPGLEWEKEYRTSGLPALFNLLAGLAQEEGPQLKAAWPRKRKAALDLLFREAATASSEHLDRLQAEIESLRSELLVARKEAAKSASESAASKVEAVLKRSGIYMRGGFQRDKAQELLVEALRDSIQRAVLDSTRNRIVRIQDRFGEALERYVEATNFSLQVQDRFKTHSYKTTVKSESVGSAVGSAAGFGAGAKAGAWAGGAAGGAVFGPPGAVIGGIIGGLLGGFLGGMGGSAAGKQVGKRIYTETVTVRVPAGTNAAEVIATVRVEITKEAIKLTRKAFKELDEAIFGPLLREVTRLRVQVDGWANLTGGR